MVSRSDACYSCWPLRHTGWMCVCMCGRLCGNTLTLRLAMLVENLNSDCCPCLLRPYHPGRSSWVFRLSVGISRVHQPCGCLVKLAAKALGVPRNLSQQLKCTKFYIGCAWAGECTHVVLVLRLRASLNLRRAPPQVDTHTNTHRHTSVGITGSLFDLFAKLRTKLHQKA